VAHPLAGRCAERRGWSCLVFVGGQVRPRIRPPTFARPYVLADAIMIGRVPHAQDDGHELSYHHQAAQSWERSSGVLAGGARLHYAPHVRLDNGQTRIKGWGGGPASMTYD